MKMLKTMTKTQFKTKIETTMKSKAMTKIKARAKQLPFNIFLPWGESIAQYLQTNLTEIETNLPNDPSLKSMVQSTCSMVRDFAVKALMSKNQKTAITLNDIC